MIVGDGVSRNKRGVEHIFSLQLINILLLLISSKQAEQARFTVIMPVCGLL
jgi:hypothetical protein